MKPLTLSLVTTLVATLVLSAADNATLKPGGTPPKAISRTDPEFPHDMRTAGLLGDVTIDFVVNSRGEVESPRVVRSNNPAFERPAIEALLKWRFEPGVMNGRPVNTRMRLPIKFQLTGGRGAQPWQVEKGSNHRNLPPEFQWDEPPEPVNTVYPVYPFEPLRAKVNAKFNVAMIVNPAGEVREVRFADDAPPEFTGAVRAMASMWQFKPATKGRQPCWALVTMTQEFRADDRGTVPIPDTALEILRELARPEPRIVTLDDLDARPADLSHRETYYPPDLHAQGVEGEAVIEFFIDRRGDVQLPRIVSATHEEFGHFAALTAACWRFEAPRKDRRPVTVRTQRTVTFRIRRDPNPAPTN